MNSNEILLGAFMTNSQQFFVMREGKIEPATPEKLREIAQVLEKVASRMEARAIDDDPDATIEDRSENS